MNLPETHKGRWGDGLTAEDMEKCVFECTSFTLPPTTIYRHTYTFTRPHDGLTDIDVVVVRDGKNLKGWVLGVVLGTIGKSVLKKAFENSVKAIEARNNTREGQGHHEQR